jgi:hypothetical protein
MVFETLWGLAAATSWRGEEWRFVGEVLWDQPPSTEYGRVARRAPSLVHWGPPDGEALYHLWFEGVGERQGSASAIVHATSATGLQWAEAPEPIAFEGHDETPWRREVGEPSVVVSALGGLVMWFVGRDPETGATTLGRASSEDGVSWAVDDLPVRFEPPEPAGFERDGMAQPSVVLRGSVLHLWYSGRSGARTTIGYAVAEDPEGTIFRRVGPVLEASQPWEEHRVAAPAVLELAVDEGSGSSVHLWYAGGVEGRESIGLARRWTPGL